MATPVSRSNKYSKQPPVCDEEQFRGERPSSQVAPATRSQIWRPNSYFISHGDVPPFGLVILNQPIEFEQIYALWINAKYVVCADGGANRLLEAHVQAIRDGRLGRNQWKPDAIVGDLDSLDQKVRAHYESLGVPILFDPDQSSTDLTKSLRHIATKSESFMVNIVDGNPRVSYPFDVLILGGMGGRLDQAFSQLHHLYTTHANENIPRGRMLLLTPNNISFVLEQGEHTIHTPSNGASSPDIISENVGLIPLGGPCCITTKGLEWDVREWKTSFGSQMSTSNHIRANVINVETDGPILFTIELHKQESEPEVDFELLTSSGTSADNAPNLEK